MAGLFKKIQTVARNRTTYKVGLLQAKAFRILKNHTGRGLEKYNLSTIDWALLGLLCETKSGLRSMALAKELGVEAPFVTSLFGKLNKMGLIDSKRDPKDSRAKIIFITAEGKKKVEEIEMALRSHMKELLTGSSIGDLASYINVLETIIKNK